MILGPNSHWEFLPAVNLGPAPVPHVIVVISIVSPTSRGTLTINSADPFDPPVIDPAAVDVATARDAIRNVRKFFAKSWEGYIWQFHNYLAPSFYSADVPKGADYGIVDPNLKVKGLRGLRVVDASIMPFVIAGHTQMPESVIAERAADMIKQDWTREIAEMVWQ